MSTRDASGGNRDDAVERVLRDTLAREADLVQPSADGLARITELLSADDGDVVDYRDGRLGGGWRPWVIGLVAAAVLGVVAGLLFVNNNDQPNTELAGTPTDTSSPTPTEGTPTTTPTETATESPTTQAPTGELKGVPVYWLGESKANVWLYREFHTVPDVGGAVASAVSAMTSMEPDDPDYSTPWSPASSVTATVEGGAITVDISADAFAGAGVGSQVAERAVQQLVWTATAAAGIGSVPVTITVDGGAYDAWGAVSLGEPMSRDGEARGRIWIDSPTEGQNVNAGTAVKVTGTSMAFEANIHWEVQDESGAIVQENFAMGGSQTFENYEFTIEDLEPGTYTLHVYAPDMSDGESPEGLKMHEQTRTFTVG